MDIPYIKELWRLPNSRLHLYISSRIHIIRSEQSWNSIPTHTGSVNASIRPGSATPNVVHGRDAIADATYQDTPHSEKNVMNNYVIAQHLCKTP